eukprot:scaffold402347_cov38-Attheya_sp.AAC.2
MGGSLATLGGGTGVSGSTTGTLGGVRGVAGGAGLAGLVTGIGNTVSLMEFWWGSGCARGTLGGSGCCSGMMGASTLGGRCLGVT